LFSQPKVSQLYISRQVQQAVLRLQVTINDVPAVKVIDRLYNLADVKFCLGIRKALYLAKMEKKFTPMAKVHNEE